MKIMSKIFSIVIPNESQFSAEDIERQAIRYGLTKNAFIIKAISFFMDMEPKDWKQITGISDTMDIPAAY